MKKIFYYIFGFLFLVKYNYIFADAGIFEGSGVSGSDLRNGEIKTSDIGPMIKSIIDYGIYIAGTIAIIFIIIGAYQMLFGTVYQDNTKGKNTITMAIFGLIIASLAWLFIEFIFDNFN